MSDVDNELCYLGLLEPNSFDQLCMCICTKISQEYCTSTSVSVHYFRIWENYLLYMQYKTLISWFFFQIYPQPPFGMWSTTGNGSYIEVKCTFIKGIQNVSILTILKVQ